VLALLSRRLARPVGALSLGVLLAAGLSATPGPASASPIASSALPADFANLGTGAGLGNPAALPGLPDAGTVAAAQQANPLALASNPVDYAYDGAGQLRGVAQTSSGGATGRYNYDATGNLTSIDRYASTTLSVVSVVPSRAPVGASVTISGTAFATTVVGNAVKFNGTTATVTSASAVRLVATVPAGATSGTVTVTTTGGTATSQQAFTVDPAVVAPTVTGFSPSTGAAGTSVTITGTGFDPTAGNNNVAFGRTRARVTAATSTSLTVAVPDSAGAGKLTVGTSAGSASSASDFTPVPDKYASATIAQTGTLAIDGATTTVSIPTAGQKAILRFTGVQGQRLSLGFSDVGLADFIATPYSPYGGSFGRDQFDQGWQFSTNLIGGIPLPPLPSSGTYEVVIDPVGSATGSVTATLSSRVTGTLSLTGAGTTVNLNRVQQQAELSFPATSGQRIGIGFTGLTFIPGTVLVARLTEPNGAAVFWLGPFDVEPLIPSFGDDLDFTAAETGTYKLIIGSESELTGSMTVTASPELPPVPVTLGTAKTVAIARPGQDARLTFSGTAGQLLGFDITAYTFAFNPFVVVYAPDGSVLKSSTMTTAHLDLPALPDSGTYQMTISPFSSTGSLTFILSLEGSGGSVVPDGATVTASIAGPGQSVRLSFTTTVANQWLTFAFTGYTFASTLTAQVVDSAGSRVSAFTIGPLSVFSVSPPAAGNYTLILSSTSGATGSTGVALSTQVSGGAFTIGTAKNLSATRPGQTTAYTFTATAGQRLSLSFGSFAFSPTVGVEIHRPDGSLLQDTYLSSLLLNLGPLPVAGTYVFVMHPPFAMTGSSQVTLLGRIDAGASTVGGAAKVLTVSQAGFLAETSFTATAGERLSFGFSNWTFDAGAMLRGAVIDANGQQVYGIQNANTASLDITISTAGTYGLIIGAGTVASGTFGTGSVTATISDQQNAGTISLDTAKTITFGRVGQSARVTFAGTAGQNLALNVTGSTLPFFPQVTVHKPDGTGLVVIAEPPSVSIQPLPTTGNYEIDLSPSSSSGVATFTLTTRSSIAASADVRATHRADGAADPVAPAAAQPQPLGASVAGAVKAAPMANPLSKVRQVKAHNQAPAWAWVPDANQGWTPDRRNLTGVDWNAHLPDSPNAKAATVRAPPGVTALAGRILAVTGAPLANVSVSIGGTSASAKTDAAGQFLLRDLPAGHRVLRVDGATGSSGGRVFGLHDIGIDITAGQTEVLPFPIWLTALDTQHVVHFASPTIRQTTITTPAIPGLQVVLPAGAVVRDVNGNVVTSLGITAIPVDRAPFPLPRSQVPVYFTVQPGSSYVFPTGARVIYPNFTHDAPGARMDFWHYDPAGKGWYVYGHGSVTADGTRVVPDAGVEVYQFTGAMLITPGEDPPPPVGPAPGGSTTDADPVDLGSGLLVDRHTDLTVDDILPIGVTRTYQQSDTGHRTFGIGVTDQYDIRLFSNQRFVEADVVLPDGGKVHYHRITPGSTGGNDFLDAAFAADPTPTEFNGSILVWNGDGWDLRLRNGLTYIFGDEAPLRAIRDKFGNTVTIIRAPAPPDDDNTVRDKGPITQVTSPNGHWIKFTNDSANRVTKAEDNLGRSVSYTYDAAGHLSTVTDVRAGVTTYTYDANGRLATIKDPRNTVYLTNTYDTNGRVAQQTIANGGHFQLTYTTDSNGRVTATSLTDPRGNVRRLTFNTAGYPLTDTRANGTTIAQTTAYTRNTSNLISAVTDPLGRQTTFAHDAFGNPTSITEQAGTASARTTTIAYGGPFDQVSQVTDPLGHAWTFTYAASGALSGATDPLSRTSTVVSNEFGQPTRVTDNLSNATNLGYTLGDLTSVTDPLGRVFRQQLDPAGRVIASTDPAGATSRLAYDAADNLTSAVDPLGQTTSFAYDVNGNLHTVTDPRAHTTTYGYDTSDRLTSITDPLNRVSSANYDTNDNITTATDGRGTQTAYTYDALDRPTTVRYGVSGTTQESQATYGYDADNRVTSVTDSAGGTTTLTYDGFDRQTRAVTPQGQVDYGFDAADRRTSMTVAGQSAVTYTYNNADQVTGISRGSDTVALGYDGAGRLTGQTMPGPIGQTYSYDAASQLTAITYTGTGGASLGDLSYTYDADGRPIHLGGAFARATIPAAYGPATYDAANQLSSLGSTSYTYDAAGDMTSDGTTTYTWNARAQLISTAKTGLTVNYGYDGLGRRSSLSAGGATTGFLYDGLQPVQELSGTTPTANLLTGGLDQVFARTTSAGRSTLLSDALGSTIGVTDASNAVGGEYTYEPYGAASLSGTDGGNRYRYAGTADDGNGLDYNRARYYAPGSGRFTAPDPLGIGSGSANPYTYTFNQPTGMSDPMGTKPEGSGEADVDVYRFMDAANPSDFRPRSTQAPPSTRATIDKMMADPTWRSLRALAHAEGVTDRSPFVSTVLNPQRALQTTDTTLQSIIRNAPDLVKFRVPANRLTFPESDLSRLETEVLFDGDLTEFILSMEPNPFRAGG
jgi:RHS repeat-associated protein